MYAMNWFSVRDEISTPTEINAAPSRNSAMKFATTIPHVTAPKKLSIRAYTKMMAIPMVYIARAAKYFPRTIPPRDTGAVRSP